MQRVDGYYLYQVGSQIHPLENLKYQSESAEGTTYAEAYYPILIAEGALEPLLSRSVFQLRTSRQAGQDLLDALREVKNTIELTHDQNQVMSILDVFNVTSRLSAFEAVLNAELSLLPLYVVTRKAAFDTPILVEAGALCFPEEVIYKVPEAVPDLEQGTKCIAFELPTAAGFHLHRANESILHRY